MGGEGAAAEAGDGGVERAHAHLQARVGIGDAHAAGVVQVQRDGEPRESFLDGAHDRADLARRGPRHGVREHEVLQPDLVLRRDRHDALDDGEHALDRHLALEIAAEGRLHRAFLDGDAVLLVDADHVALRLHHLIERGVLVARQERLRGAEHDAALHVDLSRGDGAMQPLLVEPEARILHARLLAEKAHDLVGVGHAGHALGIHEGDHLDLLESRFR